MIKCIYNSINSVSIKKKIKIAAKTIHEHLHREPFYVHPKMGFIPNAVINIVTLFVALALIGTILYLLLNFLIKAFYNL